MFKETQFLKRRLLLVIVVDHGGLVKVDLFKALLPLKQRGDLWSTASLISGVIARYT